MIFKTTNRTELKIHSSHDWKMRDNQKIICYFKEKIDTYFIEKPKIINK